MSAPPTQDWSAVQNRICDFLDHSLQESGAAGFVLGLSGGVDSATVAYLAAGRHRDRTLGVLMPDTRSTPDGETADGIAVAQGAGIRSVTIPIDSMTDAYASVLNGDRRAMGNLRARIRTSILYHYANTDNLLVLGSTDRSEYLLGYYTKFGDGACDLTPIIHLYKTQVRPLAAHLGVPDHICSKKSSPHLWPGHDAEEEIGASYHTIDRILYGTYEMHLPVESCAAGASVPPQTVRHILGMVNRNVHKRESPRQPA